MDRQAIINQSEKDKRTCFRQTSSFALVLIVLSATLFSVAPQNIEATTTSSRKFFAPIFLQYVDKDAQLEIYRANMGYNDTARIRVLEDDVLNPEYVQAVKSLPGPAGVTFKSSHEVVENAQRVRDLGFTFIELNLEPGISPAWDNNNVVQSFKIAAQASHEQGLKFRATPTKPYTTQYGPQIAPYIDYLNIQAQSLQGDSVRAFSDYVYTEIQKLKSANPDLIVTVQVSTNAGNAPGLTVLQTMKRCIDSVMDIADGATVWFGSDRLDTLESFVEWYNTKYPYP
jgi:hypothetical protein